MYWRYMGLLLDYEVHELLAVAARAPGMRPATAGQVRRPCNHLFPKTTPATCTWCVSGCHTPLLQDADWRRPENAHCGGGASPWFEAGDGRPALEPLEVVFVRFKHWMVKAGIAHAVRAAKMQIWDEQAPRERAFNLVRQDVNIRTKDASKVRLHEPGSTDIT